MTLARLLAATLILFCLELGLFLFVVPWTALWQHNYFLLRWPQLSPWLNNYFLRGAVSGLGLLDAGFALSFLWRFHNLAGKIEELIQTAEARKEESREDR